MLKDPFSLEGQVALITGGGTGLGLGMAKTFAAQGAKVIIAGRREEVLQSAVKEIGDSADYRVHDVVEFSKSEALINSVQDQHGRLTVLINNAGIGLRKPTEEVSEEEFMEVLNVHVMGAFSLSKWAARSMLKSGGGSILFTASMTSYFSVPGVTSYAASKSAYLGMVRNMAAEWGPKGIRVNAIAPGWIETDLSRASLEDPVRSAKILGRTPMARFGEAEDIGWAAVYLASPAAKFVTGVCLPVDGGVLIGL
jgi:NAD(P)-dependent dehydrogenase (short-subunit alcohol dehydrogenase family)